MSSLVSISGMSMEQFENLFPFDVPVIVGYRGSIAHEMYVPNDDPNSVDDKDLMGVFMGSPEHYLGFGRKQTIERVDDPWDVVSYELNHFVRLLLKSNPNVMGMLWLKPNYYIQISGVGQRLIDNRDRFATKAAYNSFTGYAHSQLSRMESGSKKGYMGDKRKALVEKYGFDTKNASHLIRLLRMGIEFLSTGELNVAREDARELLAIKKGEWPLEKVKKEAEVLFDASRDALINSPLPEKPDRDWAEQWLVNEISAHIAWVRSLALV